MKDKKKNGYVKPVIAFVPRSKGEDVITTSTGMDNFGEIPDEWWEEYN